MSFALLAGDRVHIKGLNQLLLIHESLEGISPSFCDGVDVLDLLDVIKMQSW